MKPRAYQAREGRANPKGIPYLYLADERSTAMAEVRPWIASYISLGEFVTVRDLRLVDCSVHARVSLYFSEPPPDERDEAVWSHIDHAFAVPTMSSDNGSEYVPTQVLAEAFGSGGYDGIIYRSSLGDGRNVVLFDLDAADLIGCSVFQLRSIQFAFEPASNPYVIESSVRVGTGRDAIDG
jgi:RES domain-containing protein